MMRKRLIFIFILISSFSLQCVELSVILSESLREIADAMPLSSFSPFQLPDEVKSGQVSLLRDSICSHFSKNKEELRIGCCKPPSVRYIYNAMLQDNRIVVFNPILSTSSASSSTFTLPKIVSVHNRQESFFNMNLEIINDGNLTHSCKIIKEGTLHVFGKHTTYNLFHALNDNIMALLSQFILDLHFEPSVFAFLPRYSLSPSTSSSSFSGVTHMHIMKDIFDETIDLRKANGVCFRRIIWGEGARLVYNHALMQLRRSSADLLRLLVLKLYNPPVPSEFLPILITKTNHSKEKNQIWDNSSSKFDQIDSNSGFNRSVVSSTTDRMRLRGMNIVIYSRGESSTGRTIAGEGRLATSLMKEGARVVICCNNASSSSLLGQLGLAVHADVIMGLHGAGLSHSFFTRRGSTTVELKTLYGYGLDLFPVVTDSREGFHLQINIKNYFKTNGHRPIDNALITRIVDGLVLALHLKTQQNLQNETVGMGTVLKLKQFSGDIILSPSSLALSSSSSSHILGPTMSAFKAYCMSLPFAKFWPLVEDRVDLKTKCLGC